jgi:hypothetical protein
MNAKLAIIGLVVPLLAACAPASPPAPPPAPVPAEAPAPPAPPPEPPAATAPIPIRSLGCADLLGAADDDRAAASMFFIGYRAALAHVHDLSISQIQAIEEKALATCTAHQTMPAAQAFGEAIATRNR